MNLDQLRAYMAEEIYRALLMHVTWDELPTLEVALESPVEFYQRRAVEAQRLAAEFTDIFNQWNAHD